MYDVAVVTQRKKNTETNVDDVKTRNQLVLWYVIGSAGIIICILVLGFIAYQIFVSYCGNEDDQMRDQVSGSIIRVAGKRASRQSTRTGSNSMQVIVKLPSLTESSVIVPESLDRAPLLLASNGESKESVSKSAKNVKRMPSKSLKISECGVSDMKGKISMAH